MGAVLLAAAYVAYNNVANRWRPFHGWAYLPLNIAAGIAVVVLGARAFGLDRREMGLSFDGAGLGALLALPVLLVIGVAFARPVWRARLADERYRDVDAPGAAFTALVRIPFGTALFEEALFRGVLFAAFAGEGTVAASIASSITFGLWHIEPTRLLARANRPSASRSRIWLAVAGGVALTAAAGLLFSWLRVTGGGVAAPAIFHALVNVAGALAAIGAHRGR